MRLYLDVETNRKDDEKTFIDEEVIAIGLLVDWTDRTDHNTEHSLESLKEHDDDPVEFKPFTAWTNGEESPEERERAVVTNFYKEFINLVSPSGRKRAVVVGFNLLRFDVLLLIQKGVKYNVMRLQDQDSVKLLSELNKLWHDTLLIDYMQVLLPANNMRFRGLKLDNIAKELGGLCPSRETGGGSTVAELYERKDYDKILKHLREDLETIRCIDLKHNEVIQRLGKVLPGGGEP